MSLLFINGCVRDNSRTRVLADYLISKLGDEIITIDLQNEDIAPLDFRKLSERDSAIVNKDTENRMLKYAVQFSNADIIVVASPFWDLSFSSLIKVYFENVTAVGVTFDYDKNGIPFGMCKAKKLYYVTTAGGQIFNKDFGFGYIKELCRSFYGIPQVEFINAQGLDIVGADVESIMDDAKKNIDKLFE